MNKNIALIFWRYIKHLKQFVLIFSNIAEYHQFRSSQSARSRHAIFKILRIYHWLHLMIVIIVYKVNLISKLYTFYTPYWRYFYVPSRLGLDYTFNRAIVNTGRDCLYAGCLFISDLDKYKYQWRVSSLHFANILP